MNYWQHRLHELMAAIEQRESGVLDDDETPCPIEYVNQHPPFFSRHLRGGSTDALPMKRSRSPMASPPPPPPKPRYTFSVYDMTIEMPGCCEEWVEPHTVFDEATRYSTHMTHDELFLERVDSWKTEKTNYRSMSKEERRAINRIKQFCKAQKTAIFFHDGIGNRCELGAHFHILVYLRERGDEWINMERSERLWRALTAGLRCDDVPGLSVGDGVRVDDIKLHANGCGRFCGTNDAHLLHLMTKIPDTPPDATPPPKRKCKKGGPCDCAHALFGLI